MGDFGISETSPELWTGISAHDYATIAQWNDKEDVLENYCLHEVVESQAQLTPTALAISAWDGRMTYAELDRYSSQFANRLIEAGVQPQEFVLFLHEKCRWAPVVIIAILKAGAICVPLDPSNASKRLDTVLDDTKARFAVTSASLANVLSGVSVETVIADPRLIVDGECLRPRPLAAPSDAAFLMYSSGSTGRPKGIVQEHGALCFSIRHHSWAMGIRPHSRTLQFAAFTFDTSMGDMFGTFMQGAVLCVCSDWERLNDLSASIQSLQANYACLTPTVVQQLDPVEVPTLRTLVVGGEAMPAALVEKWANKLDLINVYGITECLVWTFTTEPLTTFSRSIGRPSCGRAWIVDVDDPNKLLAIGAVGELLIEGPNIAREYLNVPEKTAKAFIAPPEWLKHLRPAHRAHAGKVYRSGDLARYTEDGAIDFMGRKDTQVKLNGQRVELGEIEYRMTQCLPAGTQVAALVVTDPLSSRSSLIGCVCNVPGILDEHYSLDDEDEDLKQAFAELAEQLRKDLSTTLPQLLIPTAIMPVGKMPLTVSGKLDRLQLQKDSTEWHRKYQAEYSSLRSTINKPSTDSEKRLAALWSEIFGLDTSLIGLDHEFVRLGGDSAQAMRLVSKARKLGFGLSVAQVLHHQRLGDMAAAMQVLDKNHQRAVVSPFELVSDPEAVRKEASRQCNVPETSVQDAYMCTPLQQGLLALSLANPGSYMARKAFDVPFGVSLEVFTAAWAEVYRQFDILRTRIIDTGDGLVQVVIDEDISWDKGTDLDDYLQDDRARAVSLGAQLNRFAIIQSGKADDPARIVWISHHCTYDGWSEHLILQAVGGICLGEKPRPHQIFNVFAKYLQHRDLSVSETYWKEQLAGAEAPSFPVRADASRVPQHAQSTQRTVQLKPRDSFTASTIVRSALAILNTRYTNTDEALYGAVMSGRNAEIDGIDTVVGPTISTMPIRIRVDSQMGVQQFLDQVQKQSIGMIPHEAFGLQSIRNLEKEAEGPCNFQCLLVVQAAEDSSELSAIKVAYEEATDADQYPLTIDCKLGAGQVFIEAFFDPGVLDKPSVERMLVQLDCIVQQLLNADADQRIEDINPAGPEDLSLIWKWNADYPRSINRCVHQIVEDSCRLTPTKQAICSWDGDFTYGELDALSTTLALQLQGLAIGPEVLVPVCFERSKWAAVSVLAINKAGGAFVLLNPTQPVDRLRSIISQTNSQVILSCRECSELSQQLLPTVLVVEDSLKELQKNEPPNQAVSVPCRHSPDGLMYVVFTSGTTGTPKGIMVENRSFCTYIEALARMTGAKSSWRGLVSSAYSFDSSLEEMLMPLMIGGTTCMPSQHEISNDLTGAMNRMGVHWGVFTPSLARLVNPRELKTMTDIYIGGEQMTDEIVNAYGSCLRLTNTYGPSECCPTGCVSSTPELYGGHIGRGVACRTWVVDSTNHERLMPVGCIGELLLDGPNVGRGYLHDEEKTRKAFIDPPSWQLAVETPPVSNGVIHYPRRLYKTGDLVRYCSNGTLEYLGRKDQQIKLYGQRVELSEIELHIQACLAEAADVVVDVATRDPETNQQLLTAFLVFKAGRKTSIASYAESEARIVGLRQALSSRLPSYMVPSLYLECAKLPLTSSDKIDRRSLKQMVVDMSEEEYLLATGMTAEKRIPGTSTEVFLQRLWAEILKINPDHIGLDDEFNRMGGDSIQAMRLAASARQQGWTLTVASITKCPSLEQMSRQMIHKDDGEIAPPKPFSLLDQNTDLTAMLAEAAKLCGIDEALIEDVYPCSHLQEGLMALSLKNPGSYVVHDRFEIPENMDLSLLERACSAVVERNPILRTRIVHAGHMPGLLQVVLKHDFHWNSITYSSQKLGLGDFLCRFETSCDEQLSKRVLTWTLHHALYDGWSMSLLQRQLEDFCNGHETSRTVPYSCFIRYAKSLPAEAVRNFWSQRLAGAPPVHFPKLPSASYLPHPDRSTEKSVTVEQKFASHVAMSSFVQAAWAIAVSRHTENNNVSFGTTISGRKADLPGVEAITGPTFATVPTVVCLHDNDNKTTLLERLQSETLEQMSFEQAGLHTISTYTAETNQVCGFQTLLVIQPVEDHGAYSLVEASVERSDIDTYPVNLECQLTKTGLIMKTRFDSTVISEFQVNCLLSQFCHIVTQLCSPIEMQIRDMVSLSPEDLAQIRTWNSVSLDPIDTCLHDLVLAKCNETPWAQAVCAWDGDFTYHELEDLTRTIGLHLQEQGVKSGQVVPILFDKSKWAVAAMFAILRAGAACVCLDPVNHPIARMATIVQAAKANTIVCGHGYYDVASDLVDNAIIVGPGAKALSPNSSSTAPLVSTATPRDAAFLIFTSGSTGVPKGIVHEHRSLSSSYHALGAGIKLNCNSRVFQYSAFTFDMSVIDTFATLVNGGCVCIPSDEERLNDVEGSFMRLGANEAFFTPSFARQLNPARLAGLRTLRLGGEAISKRDVEFWAQHAEVFTVSGPAEVSMCTAGVLNPNEHMPPDAGNMINGLSWIADVDDETRLVPIGVIGELLVEGPTLAREYLNQPDTTKRAFVQVPDWLSDDCSKHRRCVYKTGDLVRYNADGSLQLLGRRDGQVKIRGQRIELEEVEHHFIESIQTQAPWINGLTIAVDVVRPADDPEKPYLVAFLASESGIKEAVADGSFDEFASAVLRGMQSHLPPYMIPSTVLPLEEIPTTESKKIDRKKLRAMGSRKSTSELLHHTSTRSRVRLEPSSPMERMVLSLWSTVLKVDEEAISADDTFVQLGGDSIRAITFVSAARSKRLAVTVADVFRNPQLRELAKVMRVQDHLSLPQTQPAHSYDGTRSIDNDLLALIVRHVPELASTKCVRLSRTTPGQEAILAARSSSFEAFQPAMTFTARSSSGDVDIGRFMRAWEQTVAQHDILRTVLVLLPDDSTWYQYVLEEHQPEIHYIAGNDRSDYKQSEDLLKTQHLPAHQMLIQRENHKSLTCTLNVSHALIDGGCVDELFSCVKQHYNHPHAPDVPSTPQYFHFQNYLQARPTDEAMQFWSDYLRDARPCLFPSDGSSNGSLQDFRSRTVSIPDSSRLRSACLASGITPPVLIQSAWALTVRQLTSSDEVILGCVVSNREIDSIRRVIGPAFGVVPRRLRISEAEGLTDVVKKCQDDWLNCLPHQHLSFWEYHQRVHGSSPHQALFHTAINYRRFGRSESDEMPADCEDLVLDGIQSRDPYEFDLLLGIDDDGDNGDMITAKLDYWASAISEERVTALIGLFENSLEDFARK
ncbi:hypothetical protein DHEL01_v205733 [Diaporthe helianthi]|uniref:Carrier domain-containing protein n=1 Tax=Diaporthe helianthi TaxID=158607 RepID=A0A2P5I048_DIAHE|nr:hypothetical protein DHEL01_v205733 [Diaporthe helianthi]